MCGSFHKPGYGVVDGLVASGAARSSPEGDEARTDRANGECAVSQSMVSDLALQKSLAVHLHVRLETLFRGPTLGLFSMAGRAARDRAGLRREGQREAVLSRRETANWERIGWGWASGRGV